MTLRFLVVPISHCRRERAGILEPEPKINYGADAGPSSNMVTAAMWLNIC
jgi:hypothetical protein